ncbi:fibronectin type III domain-containing protein [Streptomyces candidus]|uniref:fibronectin type III domain-containing protein n=1 Tax=Streptomyces candidus TaxID=67283 RepID=UPI00160F0D65|nr:fibronectin type III domain-containing protein [Streptomyces candidus]
MRGPAVQRPTVRTVLACALLLPLLATAACGGGKEAQPPRDTTRPAAPAGVTAQSGSATSVHVMWSPATDDRGVTGYEVYAKGRKVRAVAATTTMVDVDRLTPSHTYDFTVRAKDAAGNLSAPSAVVTARTRASAPDDRTPPTAPTGLRGTVTGGTAVTLSWGAATDTGGAVTAYDVYQEDSRIHSAPGTETTTRVDGLRPGTVYTFTVRARDAAENSSPDSNSLDLTTPSGAGRGPSTAPTGLTVTAGTEGGARTLVLRWTPPRTGGEVKEHQLHLNGRFATTIVWGAPPPPGPVSYTLTVAEPPGTRYRVALRAKLPDGKWGDFSAVRTVTTSR